MSCRATFCCIKREHRSGARLPVSHVLGCRRHLQSPGTFERYNRQVFARSQGQTLVHVVIADPFIHFACTWGLQEASCKINRSSC